MLRDDGQGDPSDNQEPPRAELPKAYEDIAIELDALRLLEIDMFKTCYGLTEGGSVGTPNTEKYSEEIRQQFFGILESLKDNLPSSVLPLAELDSSEQIKYAKDNFFFESNIPDIISVIGEHLKEHELNDEYIRLKQAEDEINRAIKTREEEFINLKKDFGDKIKERVLRLVDFIQAAKLPLPKSISTSEIYRDDQKRIIYSYFFPAQQRIAYAIPKKVKNVLGREKEIFEYQDIPQEKESLAYLNISFEKLLDMLPEELRYNIAGLD